MAAAPPALRPQWLQNLMVNVRAELDRYGLAHECHEIKGSRRPGRLRFSACSTTAFMLMIACMFASVARRTCVGVKEYALRVLRTLADNIIALVERRQNGIGAEAFPNLRLSVEVNGVLSGWDALMEACGNPAQNAWNNFMVNPMWGFALGTPWRSPQLKDVLTFGAFVMSGKAFRADYDSNLRRKLFLIQAWHRLMISIVGPGLGEYVRDVLAGSLTERNPPLLRFEREGVRTRALPVDARTAWALLVRARDLHTQNANLILAAKNNEADYNGLSTSNSTVWRKMETLMYYKIQRELFTGQKQVCTVADPSTHGSEETMVGIVYAWSINFAAVGLSPIICLRPP